MPELRQNRFTKEWVIIATERAKRPEELKSKKSEQKVLPHYSETCPFCPGNEHLAPPEVTRVEKDGKWVVRVVPNKFSALSREGLPTRTIEKSHRSMNGVGIHDVIVEGPDHASTTALATDAQVTAILRTYRERYIDLINDKRITQVTIFKNHGAVAGSSLEHPHSQLIATPVISHQVRERLYESLRHYDEYGECMFCESIKEELAEGSRVVMESEYFIAVEPYASNTPFTTHIYPKRHMACFGEVTMTELGDLGKLLRTFLGKLYVGLDNPDYNYTIRSAPSESCGAAYYHWYISVIPRLTKMAGFEIGSGMFINVVLPETAAEYLRKVNADVAMAVGAK